MSVVGNGNEWKNSTQKPVANNLRTHFSLDLRKPAEVHLNPNIKYKFYRKNNENLPELTI
ncbi:hypothetical protein GCM10022291_13000 [Postechiella marina]|uniref:Uncharacterized protein n=1 Tax=Postechiella marina TaxID=943941 RepID=A0ABP8C5R4_9FLAO